MPHAVPEENRRENVEQPAIEDMYLTVIDGDDDRPVDPTHPYEEISEIVLDNTNSEAETSAYLVPVKTSILEHVNFSRLNEV